MQQPEAGPLPILSRSGTFSCPIWAAAREFSVRFAVVMLLFYYLDDAHIDLVLSLLDGVRQPD